MRVIGLMRGVRCWGGIRFWNGCCGDSLLARPIANAPYRLVVHANSEYSLLEHANSEYSLLERIRYWHRTEPTAAPVRNAFLPAAGTVDACPLSVVLKVCYGRID